MLIHGKKPVSDKLADMYGILKKQGDDRRVYRRK